MALEISDFDIAENLDSKEAVAAFLTDALETGDITYINSAFDTAIRAKGMAGISEKIGASRTSLYKTFKEGSHPKFETLLDVMNAFDMRFTATPAGNH